MRSYEKSKQAYTEAVDLMPGGVNSPVRAFKSVNMDPIFMESGQGAVITDIDGNEYIDYVLSWGPLILGHSEPKVVEAIQTQAAKATSFGAPSQFEGLFLSTAHTEEHIAKTVAAFHTVFEKLAR